MKNANMIKERALLHKGNFFGLVRQTIGSLIFFASKKIEIVKIAILKSPNSCPFRGRSPRKLAVAPIPKKDDKRTEPHEAHPIPKRPSKNPGAPTPADLLN